jgi:glucosamine-6-phosphate deaminase
MIIFVKEDYEAMSKKAANMVAGQVNLKSNSVLGLATGSTPEGMYRELVELYKDDRIDFAEVTTFNLDEYYELPIENDQSYAYYMNKNFFSQVNISSENIHVPYAYQKNYSYCQWCQQSFNTERNALWTSNTEYTCFCNSTS